MNRSQLEHILRACGAITRDREFVVIGSQSILGACPQAPAALLRSMDLDIYPKNRPEESAVIDGAIGEGSAFHQTFGYYAHGVGPETAILPPGWETRLVRVETPATSGAVGWCIDPADLAVSKLAAGREQDWVFVEQLVRLGMVKRDDVAARLRQTPLRSDHVMSTTERLFRF